MLLHPELRAMGLLRTEAEEPHARQLLEAPGVYTQKPFPKSSIGLFPAQSVDFLSLAGAAHRVCPLPLPASSMLGHLATS